jgi:hypothetical protein
MTDDQAGTQRPHGSKAAQDALGHDVVAQAVAGHITGLPPGSVISVQGPWGRGKTDVVTRVFDLYSQDPRAPEPLWIDPWRYGRPDLIRPVVVALLDRMRNKRPENGDRFRKAAASLLHASNAMLFKAVEVFVPFGAIAGAAQPSVDKLIDDVLTRDDQQQPDADADPVHEMAVRFYELVDEVLAQENRAARPGQDQADRLGKPLLICVDDLDRCLPDHQIAMLEAIHFLTSAGANCSFLVALDPVLVRQAAITHYRTDGFDSNQYLDKLFHLRVNLTALQPGRIGELVDVELAAPASRDGAHVPATVLLEGLGAEPAAVKASFETVFYVPELTNPRLVHRVFERLCLAAAANAGHDHPGLRDQAGLGDLVAWCAVAERWPQVRQMLQASPEQNWMANLTAICNLYGIWGAADKLSAADKASRLEKARSITGELPGRDRAPNLGEFISTRILRSYHPERLKMFDDILVSFGL